MSPEGNENRINDSVRNKKEEDMDHNAPALYACCSRTTFTGTSEPHQVGIISASRTGNLAEEYAALEEIA